MRAVTGDTFAVDVDALAGASGATGAEASELGEALLRRWDEPHRTYHDRRHLGEVLEAVDDLAEDARLERPDLARARLAAWYHDAVYEGAPGDDEEASARLAEAELLTLGLPDAEVAAVAGLVRATAEHALPGPTGPAAALHDADLWVLAAPAERFDAYCDAVRREYAHVPDADFAVGRSAVLTPFVRRPRLYATAHAHRRWTGRARVNLRRELDRLDAARR